MPSARVQRQQCQAETAAQLYLKLGAARLRPGSRAAYVVNNIQTGEWLEYTIDVSATAAYTIELHASTEWTTSRFHIEVDGTDVTGPITVPGTGWWGTFAWLGKTGVTLAAGNHVLRVVAEEEYFNLDAVRITQ